MTVRKLDGALRDCAKSKARLPTLQELRMTERSTEHDTFVIERNYTASPARVFSAWADPIIKAQWFSGPDDWVKLSHKADFRVCGHERLVIGPPGGVVHKSDCCYQDIVPAQRIIYTYDMHLDDVRISVSLATVEFKPAPGGTLLIFTEQGVFLDGADSAATREQGTHALLDKLGTALKDRVRTSVRR
jgi:uncharacterized protein YndB with AHSA1/START domain